MTFSTADRLPEQAHPLQGPRDAEPGQPVRAQVVVPAAVEQHLALVGPDEAAQDIEQRRLARPVRPDHAEDLPGLNRERYGVERRQAAKANTHIAYVED